MNQIKFRSATLEDLSILYEFEQGIIAAERPFDPTLKPGHINYYDLKALVVSNDTEVMVAEIDGELVGSGYAEIRMAQTFLQHERYAHLGFMFVRPEQRGKGVITQLIQRLKDWCLSKGITEIRLEVYDDNSPAIRAYEKTGFKKHMVEMRVDIKKRVK